MTIRLHVILATGLALLFGGTAAAHHSFAMFDLDKNITLEGRVKEFQWTNPHVWIQLLVTDEKGVEAEWSLEGGAPGMLLRTGWKRSSLKPDDRVKVVVHPLHSGKPGGSLVNVTMPDGRVLVPGGPAARPGQ